jgi:hypothetical protein
MFVMAIVELTAKLNSSRAAEITRLSLLIQHREGLEVNTRIIPSYEDRRQFISLWKRVCASGDIRQQLGIDDPRPPHAYSGNSTGRLTKQYLRILAFIKGDLGSKDKPQKLEILEQMLGIITQGFSFVVLQLNDAATAPRIFERLNYRGERVGIVDLARNEVFSRIREQPELAMRLYHELWAPFEASFNERAEHFFFPYCLIHRRNAKKSELFRELSSIWKEMDPEQIIGHMKPFRGPFMALDQGLAIDKDKDVSLRVDRMKRLGCPRAVYPFLMVLLHEYRSARLSREVVVDIFDLVESFLVRRAIAGVEPTGLHALFKGLWHEVHEDLTISNVVAVIQKRPTIQWPNDQELREAIYTRELAGAGICRFLLVEYDRDLPGDHPSDIPTIEHILPRSREAESEWATAFTKAEHRKLKNTLANLIPLSGPLNESLQRGPYSRKRERYEEESMFVTPRSIAGRWKEWNPGALAERRVVLGDWAKRRWPYGRSWRD